MDVMDLAQRAVACKGWRWMPGMLTQHGRICGAGYLVSDDVDEVGQPFVDCTDTVDEWAEAMPDLDDPATVGCLLALVRGAWGDQHLHVGRRIAGWGVWTSQSTPFPECVGKGDTEAEALVAALETAP